jgi:hypothetical protein
MVVSWRVSSLVGMSKSALSSKRRRKGDDQRNGTNYPAYIIQESSQTAAVDELIGAETSDGAISEPVDV